MFRKAVFETLERRLLLTTVNSWLPSGGGAWDTPSCWSLGHIPTNTEDAVINNVPASDTIYIQGTNAYDVVNSINSSASLSLTGNFLVNTTMQAAGGITLNDGSLEGATITGNTTLTVPSSGGNTLNGNTDNFLGPSLGGVTIAAGSTVDATSSSVILAIQGGLTVDGTLELGNANYGSVIECGHGAILSGTGTIALGNATLAPSLIVIRNDTNIYGPQTLTIAAGLTIAGGSADIYGYAVNSDEPVDSVVNDGTIESNSNGETIALSGATFTNNGTVSASNGGTLSLSNSATNAGTASAGSGGTVSFTTNATNIGTVSASNGGSLSLSNFTNQSTGMVTLTGGTLGLAGAWSSAGSITATNSTTTLGGTFSTAGIGSFTRSGGTVYLTGTLTNTGSTLALNAATGSWLVAGGTIVGGTITDTAAGLFTFTNNGGSTLDGVTVAAGSILDAASQTIPYNYLAVIDGLTLNGTIDLGLANGSTTGILDFAGTETVSGTGSIVFGSSTANNLELRPSTSATACTLTIASGITITGGSGEISGFFSNDSVINNAPISVTSTLTISGSITNNAAILANLAAYVVGNFVDNGSLTANNAASVYFQGTFTPAALQNLYTSGALVYLDGTLTNSGGGLVLNASTGSAYLTAGTITGGTVTTSGGAALIATNDGGTLSGVTLAGTLSLASPSFMQSSVTITNGLTLSSGQINLANLSRLNFSGSQTLGGTGTVSLAAGSTYPSVAEASATGLSIASGITIEGAGSVGSSGATLSNSGILESTGGSTLTVQGLANDPSGTLTGGSYEAVGANSILRLIGDSITTDAATLVEDGLHTHIYSDTGTTDALVGLTGITAAGTLSLLHAASETTTGNLDAAGSVAIGSGATLTASGTYTVDAASNVDGTLAASGGVTVSSSGTLTGAGAINSNLTNAGQVTPGDGTTAPGALDVSGAYTQAAGGSLTIDIGGSAAGSGYSQLNIAGAATLNGTLSVQTVNGFGPSKGQVYAIVTYASESGSFTTVNGLKSGFQTLFVEGVDPTEVDLDAAQDAADLSLSTISFPTSVTSGQTITLNYTGANLDNTAITSDWQDSIFISPDATLDSSALLLGRVQNTSGLAAMGTYTGSLTAPLPNLADGSYHIIIELDSKQQVADSNRSNNTVVASSPIQVTVPAIAIGTPVTGTITSGQDVYYKVTTTPGQAIDIAANFVVPSEATLYASYDTLPTQSAYDQIGDVSNLNPTLTFSNSTGGDYYIYLHGDGGATSAQNFTLTVTSPGLSITSFSPGLVSTFNGNAQVQIDGTGFTSATTVSIQRAGGAAITPDAQTLTNGLIVATFDLTNAAAGEYIVTATDGSQTATASNQLEVSTADVDPNATAQVVGTTAALIPVGGQITLEVNTLNPSTTNYVYAPLISVAATGGYETYGPTSDGGPALELVPPNQNIANGVGGTVVPGEVFEFQPVPAQAGAQTQFSIGAVSPNDTPIDWASQQSALQPASIPDDAWAAVYQNLITQLGSTQADFYNTLVADSQALSASGVAETDDVNQLFSFELAKADDSEQVTAVPSSQDITDVSSPLPLNFQRTYATDLIGRYHTGIFGRGWTDNYDISATTASDGDVTIDDAGSAQQFTKLANGGYLDASTGDTDTLSLVSGSYLLTTSSGQVTAFLPDGNLNYIKDANGNQITAAYNSSGQLSSLSDTSGQSLTFTYTDGNVTRIQSTTGQSASYVYDPTGQYLMSASNAQGTTSYTYSVQTTGPQAYAITSVTTPDNVVEYYSYDTQGRLIAQQGANGAAPLTYSYGAASYTITNAASDQTTYDLDLSLRTTKIADPGNNVAQFDYDRSGNVLQVAVPDEPPTNYTYNPNNTLAKVVDPLQNTTLYSYDAANNLHSLTDGLGNATSYQYDAHHNVKAAFFADGTNETFTYFPGGLLETMTDRAGVTTTFKYNALGQIAQRSDASETDNYTYYSSGNLHTASNAAGTTTLKYNALEQLVEVDEPNNQTLKYAYNSNGQRSQLITPSGTENFSYYPTGQLEKITDGNNALITSYTYDAEGRLQTTTNGNGTSSITGYDAEGHINSLYNYGAGGQVISFFQYIYNPQGLVGSLTTEAGTSTYVYDSDGQLKTENDPGKTISYMYDADGNRTSMTVNGVTTLYVVKPGTDEYSSIGGVPQQYYPDGNVESGTLNGSTATYSYDSQGRVVEIVSGANTSTFSYDALGDLASTTQNGKTTNDLVDPLDNQQVVGQYDNLGNLITGYTEGYGLASSYDASGDQSYYSYDASGDTADVTDSSGDVADSYSYTAFGQPTAQTATTSNAFTTDAQSGDFQTAGLTVVPDGQGYVAPAGSYIALDPNDGVFDNGNPYSFANASPLPGTLYGGPDGSTTYSFGASFGLASSIGIVVNDDGDLFFQTGLGVGSPGAGFSATRSDKVFDEQITGQTQVGYQLLAVGQSHEFFVPKEGRPKNYDPNSNAIGTQWPSNGYSATLNYTLKLPFSLKKVQSLTVTQVGPKDPNFISGVIGAGIQNYIPGGSTLDYTVGFENDKDASAPAQRVTVSQQISANTDWSTFEFGSFGFGGNTYTIPSGHQNYSTRLDLTATLGLYVDVTANFDPSTGLATWTFQSIDPATLDAPADPEIGFLPPDTADPNGSGFVSYDVTALAGIATGSTISADASITFDNNASIDTGAFVNTIDADAPTSSISSLPSQSPSSFTLKWAGNDAGSGIASYTVYESEDSGAYSPLLSDTTKTSTTITGAVGHSYSFYTVATDNVGNVQATPTSAQASTTIVPPSVSSFLVDNNTGQRSNIRTLTLGFNMAVALDSGAITLSKISGSTSTPVTFTSKTNDGGQTYVLTPTSGTVGGSLADGNYQLSIAPAAVHDATNSANTMTGSTVTESFFRLFGDVDGNGTVNATDYRAFQAAYLKSTGQAGFNVAFDYNNDGTINATDYRQFEANYLHSVTS